MRYGSSFAVVSSFMHSANKRLQLFDVFSKLGCFTKNTFYLEKNPTIVNFPVKNVDMKELLNEEAQKTNPNSDPDSIATRTRSKHVVDLVHDNHNSQQWFSKSMNWIQQNIK